MGTLETIISPRSFEEVKHGSKSLFDASKAMMSTCQIVSKENDFTPVQNGKKERKVDLMVEL